MRPLSPDLRQRIIDAVAAGESIRGAAARFAVHPNTVMRLVKRHREEGTIDPKPHGGGPVPILSLDDLERLDELVKQHPDWTLAMLRDELGAECSIMTIWRALQLLEITHKKKVDFAAERDKPETQHRAACFRRSAKRYGASRLIFLDESGVNTAMDPRYGWAKRGERAVGKVPGHWDSMTVLAAIGLFGVMAPMAFPGAMNAEVFVQYVEGMLVKELLPGDVVVMDNLSSHKNERALKAIRKAGARVLFLPPYHPDLNPIEKMWSKVKGLMRRAKARTIEALHEALSKALRLVNREDIRGWFESCKAYPMPA